MCIAGLIAGLLIGIVRPPWYGAVAIAFACLVLVFAVESWRERR